MQYVVTGAVSLPGARVIGIGFDPRCWTSNTRLLSRDRKVSPSSAPSPSKIDVEKRRAAFDILYYSASLPESSSVHELLGVRKHDLCIAFLGASGNVVTVSGSEPWPNLEFEGHTVRYVCLSPEAFETETETWGFEFHANVVDGAVVGGYDSSVKTVETVKQELPKPQSRKAKERLLSDLQFNPPEGPEDQLPTSIYFLQSQLATTLGPRAAKA